MLLGGLIASTFLPLMLIPALFSLTMQFRDWFVGLLFGKPAVAPAPVTKEAVPVPRPQLVHPR